MSDITENKEASERWIRINPFIAALREHLNVNLNRNKPTILKWDVLEKRKMKMM